MAYVGWRLPPGEQLSWRFVLTGGPQRSSRSAFDRAFLGNPLARDLALVAIFFVPMAAVIRWGGVSWSLTLGLTALSTLLYFALMEEYMRANGGSLFWRVGNGGREE